MPTVQPGRGKHSSPFTSLCVFVGGLDYDIPLSGQAGLDANFKSKPLGVVCRKGHKWEIQQNDYALIILVVWEIWKHHNTIVFEGGSPCKDVVLLKISQEGRMLKQAGLLKGELDIFFSGVEGWAIAAS